MDNIAATFERTTATKALVRFGNSSELVRFVAKSSRSFRRELEAFCAERGASKLIEVRT